MNMKKMIVAALLAAFATMPVPRAFAAGDACCPDEGKEKEAEKSDLDRSVKELWAAQCEHKIPQYQCDECRYEVGVVKVPASLMGGAGKPSLVGVTSPERVAFSGGRTFSGEVQLAEGKTVHVSSPLPGTLRAVFVDVGTEVKPGDPVFEVDSQDVAEAKGELLKKRAALELAKRNAEREARLFERKISAGVEVQEANARAADAEVDVMNAQGRLRRLGVPEAELAAIDRKNPESLGGRLVVLAAQGGTVLERHASVGERVEAGKELMLLSDLSEVWVWANIRPEELPALAGKKGKGATFPAEVEGPGGKRYRGTLDVGGGKVNEQTRMVKARVVVANPDGGLRPGMFVTVRVAVSGGGAGLSLPRAAVLTDAGRSFVFVHKEGEYWIRRPVKVGRASGDRVEIVRGVQPGQKVVADGAFLLKSDVLRSKMGAGCAD
jgi:cobalt-zinc-cadmium efflux system membrane fusion protein